MTTPAATGVVEGHPDAAPGPPAPPRPRAPTALVVLAVLAVGYTLWLAQSLVLPVLLAMFFALVGNPIIRLLRRLFIPRFVGAVLVLSAGLYGTYLLGAQLVEPATEWISEAPRELTKLGEKLQDLTRPVAKANEAAEDIARAEGGAKGTQYVHIVSTLDVEHDAASTSSP